MNFLPAFVLSWTAALSPGAVFYLVGKPEISIMATLAALFVAPGVFAFISKE